MVLTSECLWAVDSSIYEDSITPRAMGQKLYPDLLPELNPNWASHKGCKPAKNYRTQPSEPGPAGGLSLEGRLNKLWTGSPWSTINDC